MVLQLRTLASRNQALLVIRTTAEYGGVVGHGVIALSSGGEAHNHGKLLIFHGWVCRAVSKGLAPHALHQVAHGVVRVEQRDTLYRLWIVLPVAIKNVANASLSIGFLQSATAGILMADAVNHLAVSREDEYAHREKEILHIGALIQEVGGEHLTLCPQFQLLVAGGLVILINKAQTTTVARQHVEKLVLRGHLVRTYQVDELVWNIVRRAPKHVLISFVPGNGTRYDVVAIVPNRGGVANVRDGCMYAIAHREDFTFKSHWFKNIVMRS